MRRLSLLVALLVPVVAGAKLSETAYLRLDRPDGVYAVGDTAVVYARSSRPGEVMRMTVRCNGRPVAEREVDLGRTWAPVWTAPCDRTQWVAVVLASVDPEGEDVDVGYVVDPDGFRPGYEAPDDLYAWWEDQVARMRRKKMKVKAEPVSVPAKYADKVDVWHVEISMPEGRPVNAYVGAPVSAEPGSLPVWMNAHGAMPINDKKTRSQVQWVCDAASAGALAMDLNAHGIRDDAPADYYLSLEQGELKDYAYRLPKDRKSFYFRLMYLRLVRALDYLTDLPWWDGRRVLVSGTSQGGGQALALAGIDPRVTHVRAYLPALTDLGGACAGRLGGWPYSRVNQEWPGTPEAGAVLPYFDTALLIRRFQGQLYMEVGFTDYTCPASAVYSAFNQAEAVAAKQIVPFRVRHHAWVYPRYKKEYDALVQPQRNAFMGAFLKGRKWR